MSNEQTAHPAGSGPSQLVPGVILKAADGTLYFIPDRALATFHVTSTAGVTAVQSQFTAIDTGVEAAPRFEAYHVQLPNTLFGHSEIYS